MEQIDGLLRQIDMNLKLCLLILASLVWLAGCGPLSSSPKTSPAIALKTPAGVQTTPVHIAADRPQITPASANNFSTPAAKGTLTVPPGGKLDPAGQHMLNLALADLASRLDIPEAEIEPVALQAVTWPDASLGCPQPDMFYIQILSPGYRIILAVGDQRYRYHTDQSENVLLCEQDLETLPQIPVTPGEINDGKPWMPVQ